MPEQKSGEYEVGFGKPPVRSRFKPGESGNPKGRPRGSKNLATLLDEELNARVPITENGKRKNVTMRKAISKQTVRKAAAGEERFIKLVFELDERRSVREASAPSNNAPPDQDDRKLMKDLIEQLKIEQDN